MNLAGWLPTQSLFSTGATHSANPILPPDLLLNNNERSRWEGKVFLAVKPACEWGSLLSTYLVQTSSKHNVKWLKVVERESQDLPCSQSFNLLPGQAGKQNRQKDNMLKEKEPTFITLNFDKERDGLLFPFLQMPFCFFWGGGNKGGLSTRAILKIPFESNTQWSGQALSSVIPWLTLFWQGKGKAPG